MITTMTRVQLVAFALVTAVCASIVGARYAQLDRLIIDRTYAVTADFSDSGGIFEGAEVTYRGIAVGTVGELRFTDDGGVRARLDIENSAPEIPADTRAVVANKSAIGEQYIDLKPNASAGAHLKAGSHIDRANTEVPIDTATLLTSLNTFVASVPTDDLHTLISELGVAFDGAGPPLERILDSTSTLVADAQANLATTRDLIHSSGTVLQTQLDKGSQIQSFAADLALFTDTLVSSDADLRALVDEGSAAAQTINAVVGENSADVSAILAQLQGPVRVADENVTGFQALYLLYPYVIQGAFTVATPTGDGQYNAAFGNVLNPSLGNPSTVELCEYSAQNANGYREIRDPFTIADLDEYGQEVFRTDLGCTDPNLVPRGSTKTELERPAVDGSGADQAEELTWLLLGTTQ